MAGRIVTPRNAGANSFHRRRWDRALRAYREARARARDFRNQGVPVDALLLESYGRLCDLLLCPAPDLRALAAKIEAGEADIFRHEPSLARLAAALVQDARRLIPAG